MIKPELAAEFEKLGPWVFQFEIDGATYGGGVGAIGDIRVEQFFDYVPEVRTILELGSLEGAQTFIMAERAGVSRVVALEGRQFNLRKARFVQQLLGIRNAEFFQANVEEADLAAYGKFDAVFCSGLLYHLPEPWKLIAQLPAIAPAVFIWTHYAKEEEATEVAPGLRGKICPEGGAEEPLSGMSATATWLTLESLVTLLKRSGYGSVDVIKDDPTHPNGPAVAIGARLTERFPSE
jgi:SAM-dependent methyltransferase